MNKKYYKHKDSNEQETKLFKTFSSNRKP